MLSVRLGSIVPSLSMAKSTVQLKPWCLARILASCGSASSERYSSSPLTRTTCLPLPGPSSPLTTIQESSARAQAQKRQVSATVIATHAWRATLIMGTVPPFSTIRTRGRIRDPRHDRPGRRGITGSRIIAEPSSIGTGSCLDAAPHSTASARWSRRRFGARSRAWAVRVRRFGPCACRCWRARPSVVRQALRALHGEAEVETLSGYSLADEVAGNYRAVDALLAEARRRRLARRSLEAFRIEPNVNFSTSVVA